ncbi:hypothetical protein WEI85_34445 [Actinomycetes bacterium KLBMP 9797]
MTILRRVLVVGLGVALLLTSHASAAAPGQYHHLGAVSTGEWSGVLGRLTVRDSGVRVNTHDFVATRLMVKGEAAGKTVWLEAGWAEAGWSGNGKQRIYTYDTGRNSWTFYDKYPLADGEQVWISVHTEKDDVWQAWLYWRDAWHLLATAKLPLGGRGHVEQFVEVHTDGTAFAVPRIAVDNVQVRDGAAARYWREPEVPTAFSDASGGYCVAWATKFDTWSAGTC